MDATDAVVPNRTQTAMVDAQMRMLARTLNDGRRAAADLLAAMPAPPVAPRSGDAGPGGGHLDVYL